VGDDDDTVVEIRYFTRGGRNRFPPELVGALHLQNGIAARLGLGQAEGEDLVALWRLAEQLATFLLFIAGHELRIFAYENVWPEKKVPAHPVPSRTDEVPKHGRYVTVSRGPGAVFRGGTRHWRGGLRFLDSELT